MAYIKSKGFDMTTKDDLYSSINQDFVPTDFSKIRVGAKYLSDAVLKLGDLKRVNPNLVDKKIVLEAIHRGDINKMRDISNYFYKISGIYQRLCRYMAYMYKYDWIVTPYYPSDSVKPDKLLLAFKQVLKYMDNFGVKKTFGEIALKVIRNGSYYGYVISNSTKVALQELPPQYCRSRFYVENKPVVEFNMRYFDDAFPNELMRNRILEIFPQDFKRGYKLFKQGKLPGDYPGDESGWYLLEVGSVIKFSLNGEDFPPFIAVIPAIIDLDAAQDLDRRKMAQELLKIIIQKMPIDKNGDLVFDVDEAQQLHNNAVQMLSKAIGLDVLTTFADVEVATMADSRTTTTKDDLEKVERTVFNEAGVSQMQFNTDGNIALEKSILNDEATLWNLIQQFEDFLNVILEKFNKSPKKWYFRAQILPTTIYNKTEMAKLYKEQTQLGYSKMLPQIALGQTQSAILQNAYFENDILDLVNVFIPPLMSSTMNAEVLNRDKSSGQTTGGNISQSGIEKEGAGRPEKANDEKSAKTIANKESMN